MPMILTATPPVAQMFHSLTHCIHVHSDLIRSQQILPSNMHSYMNLAVLALALSAIFPALAAPILHGYENLLVEFEAWAF